uniref:cysteine hydrolase family protein n=1 Tax=Thaumasiovibrio occultus TaxID=1891184 RepID=UPI000B355917|nr:cysteine hydrolase family protein [Thaumasiovibrio occultus]
MTKPALLLIDLQNDYFPGGKFALWNTDAILAATEIAITKAKAKGIPVVHIQHIADSSLGIAPFFNEGTEGADIHPRILAAAPDAPVVIKAFADGFHQTQLEETLQQLGVDTLYVAGMMTQNCVTHTAISKAAEKYDVSILADLCTTVDEMIHNIALNAASTRVALVPSAQVL